MKGEVMDAVAAVAPAPVAPAEVADALRTMGLPLRPSASIDGMFGLPHSIL